MMSLSEWADLLMGDRPVSGMYKGAGVQLKVGELVLTGVVSNYAIAFTHASWGVSDPTEADNAAFIEDFIITYGGTAKVTFRPPAEEPWTVHIVDGKYVSAEEFAGATCANLL